MKPKYKSKTRQKQRELARANRAESKESNKPKLPSAERMRNLRERRKAENRVLRAKTLRHIIRLLNLFKNGTVYYMFRPSYGHHQVIKLLETAVFATV
jgi:hypothetical protein